MAKWGVILLLLSLFSCNKKEIDIGENIHVSKAWSEYPHAEVHLAINPDNCNEMIAAAFAYKQSGGIDIPACYISYNGGKKWSRVDLASIETGAADPWVLFQRNRINYIHTSGVIHVSDDEGKSWVSKRIITGNSLDFIKLIGREEGTYIYAIATNNIPTTGGPNIDPVTVFKINKNLQVEDSIHILPDSVNYKNGTPVITDNGLIIIPFYELLDRNRNLLREHPIWIAHLETEGFELVHTAKTQMQGGELSMAINPVSKRLHLVNPAKVGESYKLSYSHSDDLGQTWSKLKLIEDFERDPGSVILTASISVTIDGTVGILWPDHRTDPNNEKYGMYFMYSKDGGNSFSKSHLVSEISSPRTEKNMSTIISDSGRPVGDRFWVGGDYYGLVPVGENSFQAAWVDSRTGIAQVWSCSIKLNF